jgi:hypothetical protein
MTKAREAQTSFVAGELSPLMAGRIDNRLFKNGAAKLTNRRLLAQGGTASRPGMPYLATLTPAHDAPVKFWDFTFSGTQAYLCVFSHERLDVFAHPIAAGAAPAATLTGCPWTTAMIADLWIFQTDDTMFVFHPDMPEQVVKRTGATSFTRAAFAFEDTGTKRYQPYYKFAEPAVTLTASATSGAGVTFTASAAVFSANHIGAIIRKDKKEITVTGYTSATVVTGTCRETITTAATTDWDEQVSSAARGYFACGTIHKDRLVLGGAKSRGSGLYLSRVGAYYNFDLGTGLDDEGIWESVKDLKVTTIRALLSTDALLVWSDAAMFASFSTPANPLTPKNFDLKKQTPYGARNGVAPVEFDEASLFVPSQGAVVREALYQDTTQTFVANAVSLAASHLIKAPVALWALYGESAGPEQYAFVLDADGTIAQFHSARAAEIAGWAPWSTNGAIKALAIVEQTVYLAVARDIAGGMKLCLEKFDDAAAALDCALKATSGSPTKTFSGFAHLAGKTVAVVSKGHDLGDATVTGGGQIVLGDLSPAVTEIEAGFAFEQRVRPMPASFDLGDGPTRGLRMGLVRSIAVVNGAQTFRQNGRAFTPDFAGDDYTEAATGATGTIEAWHLGYDDEARLDFLSDRPVKWTLLALTREVRIGG